MGGMSRALSFVVLVLVSCGGPRARDERSRADLTTISIVGTNDLHGHLRALPILAGYVENLRAARAREGGAVLLIDGGDMFQGTLESNLEEGASTVRAYEALGYDAVTIGNHEFDYGPVGPNATVRAPGEDPRGALKARIAEADFPFLAANLMVRDSGARAELGLPSTLLERAGVRIGVVGVTTEETTRTTIGANVADLEMRPLADAIGAEAQALRDRGAAIVIVAAHAGGRCQHFEDPEDLSSCEPDQEIFEVARALAPGTVDAIVAGHTHQAVAHRVNGIAIVESYSYGVAFGRVDLTIDRAAARVVSARVHAPRRVCEGDAGPESGSCVLGAYEGAQVTPSQHVAEAIAPALERASEQRERPLGVTLDAPFTHSRDEEGPLGNLFSDLMLRARPTADVAIVNGGGLRTDLPAGPLRYGTLYEAFPFDNRFATVRMTGADLRAILLGIASRRGSFFSMSGVEAIVTCGSDGVLHTAIAVGGRPISDTDPIVVVSSDFLASGGDGLFGPVIARDPAAVTLEDDPTIRDAVAAELLEIGGELDPHAYHDPTRPRISFTTPRPMHCGAE